MLSEIHDTFIDFKMNNIEKHEIVGSRVLVLLDKFQEEMTTKNGVIIPTYENYQSDADRPQSRVKSEIFSTIGTVLQIPAKAREEMDKNGYENVQVGSKVVLAPNTKNENTMFSPNRETPYEEKSFSGYLLIHFGSIQSLYK